MVRTLEGLESRTLFAATIVQTGATVDVVGTKSADDIHVRLSADLASLEVLRNGRRLGSYALNSVALVRIDAGRGNDHVHVDANVMVASHLTGGVGNDILVGGGLDDYLRGMQGKDSLSGGDGDDILDGAQAMDVLTGGAGGDRLLGGDGLDVLDGGLGIDSITGGRGLDWLTGGDGADIFIGGDRVRELRDLTEEDSHTFSHTPFDDMDDVIDIIDVIDWIL